MSPSAMKSRRHNVSSDYTQTISSRVSADEFLLKIHIDLIIDIFSRLPLKSIATCRCVSKHWASVLRGPDFLELFFTKSLSRPQLLLASKKKSEVIFFSSPQPKNPEEDYSSCIATVNHRVSFPVKRVHYMSSPLNGVVCISDSRILKGRKTSELVSVICNPSTGQSFTLPKMKTRKRTWLRSFLGYDPVGKQHKMLAMTKRDGRGEEHQVLTLGTRSLTWRLIESGIIPHSFPGRECVCINGVLYYIARDSNLVDMVVCFDVGSEKYNFVNFMESRMLPATLINFQGKLASLKSSTSSFSSGKSSSFEMWILEDLEKHEWSKRIFHLPPMSKDVTEEVQEELLFFEGVTATNEFVFAPPFPSDPFYVYYYNFVAETITRIEIKGMTASEKASRFRIFQDHVEDVKLMELF